MKEIVHNLFIGNDIDCQCSDLELAIIHACKTCHRRGVGYRNTLPSTHPNYLIYKNGNQLYLNLVDMEKELLAVYTHPIIKSALSFIETNIADRSILIHCNQGMSRSPSIGLVYLARKKKIKSGNYEVAKQSFMQIYPEYNPGKGIELYLMNNWNELMGL